MRVLLPLVAGFLLSTTPLNAQEPHKFFDRQNVILFSSTAVVRTLDLHSTWRVSKHGGREVILPQSLVDNKPAFTTFSYGMVGGNIAIAYIFHKKGWHKAERILSMVHIGSVGYATWGNYSIKSGFRISVVVQ